MNFKNFKYISKANLICNILTISSCILTPVVLPLDIKYYIIFWGLSILTVFLYFIGVKREIKKKIKLEKEEKEHRLRFRKLGGI